MQAGPWEIYKKENGVNAKHITDHAFAPVQSNETETRRDTGITYEGPTNPEPPGAPPIEPAVVPRPVDEAPMPAPPAPTPGWPAVRVEV